MKIGAEYLGSDRCKFTVWAPQLKEVAVKVIAPIEKRLPMQQLEYGYWQVEAEEIPPGTEYLFELEGDRTFPDPASQFQPNGVHEASAVVDHSQFEWTDQQWKNIPQAEMILYELHVGTFTPEGTFDAIIPRLTELKELGVNAIELMPIAQFPGDRNWGYDGTYPFATQNSYGGVEGLKRLVNACHEQGIAVVLDSVYNHFGPEGNYIGNFGPYFTEAYRSPWGAALNFDHSYSYGVRNYFIQNALYWFEHFHIDMLRLDATDSIFDIGAKHFLSELAEATHEFAQQKGRPFLLVAENDLSDIRLVSKPEDNGYGLDGQWNDAFHHCLHVLLTGEQLSYYKDYGSCEQLVKAYKQGFVYSWQFAPNRNHWHGSDSSHIAGDRFVVFAQNHDQVGNRILGDRLSHIVTFEQLKLSAAAVMLAPYIPLLFMGEEYGEEANFLYFVSHSDPDLIEAVRKGRKKEFEAFHMEEEYADPESTETFERSKLNWNLWQQDGKHKVLRDLYKHLIQLRRTIPALKHLDKQSMNAWTIEAEKLIFLHRWHEDSQILAVLNFNEQQKSIEFPVKGNWHKILDSAEEKWMGSGSRAIDASQSNQISIQGHSFLIYQPA
ncbi:malto-oligosyltrehalose trehalohydrolase [Microcoleus sp. FACHB-1515]|uniref:malto-oligosyltrehalose trehalohydrolase n=1 Tax=Cyanophyceae TaxID=3028117 RepID=UPI0016881850|nr:malto-oligosyltrehalose trehalohydrolase [Microcoleus sp. FACHB-1515]MBD2091626.1 malto-oligosyltrehalose trehalohydrolase [Microcoleus sp. FACHB-1515]